MILIYGKWKVGKGVASLCTYLDISHDLKDDSERVDLDLYEAIIPSPWVPWNHKIYETGKIISELDFFSRYLPSGFRTIAITGTDGKSTTSWIMYNILEKEFFGKKSVYLSGNFDIPLSQTLVDILKKWEKKGYIVIEVSSFMAHILREFSPDYTIFTNYKSDHLNWHRDLQEYLDAKMHIVQRTRYKAIINQQVKDFADEQDLSFSWSLERSRFFSHRDISHQQLPLRDWTDGENIVVSGRRKFCLSETHFSGMHNAMNILACALVANEMGICGKHTKKYLSDILGLPHRIEFVEEKNEVRYIDDSKSTSCQSLMAALTAFQKQKTLLIAGWSDKGDTFEGLEDALKGLKYVVLIGATRDILAKKCELAWVPYVFAESMDEAVEMLYRQAISWDTVLLSPWCASFGLFRDYLDRAEKFRAAIRNLP